MVLASMINKRQRARGHAEGLKEGRTQGVKEERKRSNAKIRALAEKYDIPENELPIEDEDD